MCAKFSRFRSALRENGIYQIWNKFIGWIIVTAKTSLNTILFTYSEMSFPDFEGHFKILEHTSTSIMNIYKYAAYFEMPVIRVPF